jgi:hypothetical protein
MPLLTNKQHNEALPKLGLYYLYKRYKSSCIYKLNKANFRKRLKVIKHQKKMPHICTCAAGGGRPKCRMRLPKHK